MNRARLVRLSRWWSLSFARYEEAGHRSSPTFEGGIEGGRSGWMEGGRSVGAVGTRWSNVSYE